MRSSAAGAAGAPVGLRQGHHHHRHHHHPHGKQDLHFWQHEFDADFQEPLPPVWRATLYAEEPDADGKPTIDPVCGLVLASFGDAAWNGRCRAANVEQAKWFDLFDDGDGHLKLEEVQKKIGDIREEIRDKLPSSLHGLLMEELVQAAFKSENFDLDHSGDMTKDEWNAFLDELERRYLKYRRQLSFQCERAFYGRGWTAHLEDSEESESGDSTTEGSGSNAVDEDPAKIEVDLLRKIAQTPLPDGKEPGKMQCGMDKDTPSGSLVPPGWCEDFYYYSANHHPVHGIISCDPDHQLSSTERVFMELATLGFLFIAADLKAKLRREDEGGNLDESDFMKHSLNALISIAGMAVYYVLYLLFTCPKLGFVDKSRATDAQVRRAEMFETLGSTIGYILMAGLGVTLLVEFPMLQKRWKPVMWSRLQGYVFTWVFILLLPFNPFFAWGNNSSDPKDFDAFCAGDWIGLGQWRIEKQRFQGQCRKFKDISFADIVEEKTPRSIMSRLRSMSASSWSGANRLFGGGDLDATRDLSKTRPVNRDASPTAREMETKRGRRRMRVENGYAGGRQRVSRPSSSNSCQQKPRGSRSSLGLAEWGEVFGNADLAWRDYMSGRGFRGVKPDSATA